LIRRTRGDSIFDLYDINWGYTNVRIAEGDEEKAAFITSQGLYEPLVMLFGLCNSPAAFQGMMVEILRIPIEKEWCEVYIDDILVHSPDQATHDKRTAEVLQILMDNDLYLKAKKCRFNKSEVEWLGMILSKNSIKMDPKKLAGISEWPAPHQSRMFDNS
jgi:Reverse transcriptase (RNA-dependent DNA polymerase).